MKKEISENEFPPGLKLRYILQGHTGEIRRIAWSPDGQTLASSHFDATIRTWNTETGSLIRMFGGHTEVVYGVCWSSDGKKLASCSRDCSIRVWGIDTGKQLNKLIGHPYPVLTVAWSPVGNLLASGSDDDTVKLWDAETGELLNIFKGHSSSVHSVAWSPDGRTLASVANDSTIRLWNIETGSELKTLKGHFSEVYGVTWIEKGKALASSGLDTTIRIWDPKSGIQTRLLEGHFAHVTDLSCSHDGKILASVSWDHTVRLWRIDKQETIAIIKETSAQRFHAGLAFNPKSPVLATLGNYATVIRIWDLDLDILLQKTTATPSINYINAKVVLLGESGVGKSALGIRIVEKKFRETKSSHGAQFWQIPIPARISNLYLSSNVTAELTLWDLAGQPDYRLVHQMFLDNTDVALLLFDCSEPGNPFRGVPYWAKVLKKQAPPHAIKFLVSSRCDVSPPSVNQNEINMILTKYGLHSYLRTSACTGEGIEKLIERLMESIPWKQLPRTSTPRLFQITRELLLIRKEQGYTLILSDEIFIEIPGHYKKSKTLQAEINTVISILQAQGLIYRLDDIHEDSQQKSSLILLKPEFINQYASSIIQAARNNPKGIGALPERDVLTANFTITGFKRLGLNEERIVLEYTTGLLIKFDLCFREMGLLVFPSQINVVRPTPPKEHPPTEVTYEFSGSIETIYASLVVRMSHTEYFQREDQWRYSVEFSRKGHRLGFSIRQIEEGTGELEIYFYPGISDFDRVTFTHFITDHLHTKGINIRERFHLYCPKCGREVKNIEAIEIRIKEGELDIPCQYCTTLVMIPRSIEERYQSERSFPEKQNELVEIVEQRTKNEMKRFQNDHQQYSKNKKKKEIQILHLSDLHINNQNEALKYRTQLETDLIKELKVNRLEYLIVSGDITNYSTPEEYNAAFELIDRLVKRFGLDSSRVVVVPGNHDLNWDRSKEAYSFVYKDDITKPLEEGHYIQAGEEGVLLRNEELYKQRFVNFGTKFYKRVYGGQEYPLDYSEQAILYFKTEDELLFLGLNSCWEIDHKYQERSSINMNALSHTLEKLQDNKYDHWLKIAVWHYPVFGPNMMKNVEFLELLAVHGFQICIHGHVHEAAQGFYTYDPGRSLHIIGAGTFGAPAKGQVPGIPLQYNLLTLDKESRVITGETRKKEKSDGAWFADARWGDKNNPKSVYTIKLK
jgi:small GTP-binding protein